MSASGDATTISGQHRVLVIADWGGGGAQHVACRLLQAWIGEQHRVTLVTLAAASSDTLAVPAGVTRVALCVRYPARHMLAALFNNLRRISALRACLRRLKPDVVVSFITATNVLTLCATRGLGVPVLISERSDPEQEPIHRIWAWLRSRCYAWADYVTANSHFAVAALQKAHAQWRLAHVPNPVPIPSSYHGSRQHFFLAVGRLYPEKGYTTLLEAFALSQARERGWRLRICGDGPLRASLKVYSQQLGIATDVEWLGYQATLEQHYREAGGFVMASDYEGMPNALLEAASYAAPAIISTGCRALDEVFSDAACLRVPPRDPHALATAMDGLLAMPDDGRQTMGQLAREAIERQFAPEFVYARWNVLLAEVQDAS